MLPGIRAVEPQHPVALTQDNEHTCLTLLARVLAGPPKSPPSTRTLKASASALPDSTAPRKHLISGRCCTPTSFCGRYVGNLNSCRVAMRGIAVQGSEAEQRSGRLALAMASSMKPGKRNGEDQACSVGSPAA